MTRKKIATGQKVIFGKKRFFSGYEGDEYASSLVSKGQVYDEDLLFMINAACDRAEVILDVGANIGYMSVLMSDFAPKARIIAFEPVHSNVVLLEKNIAANNAEHVEVMPFGLGNRPMKAIAAWAGFKRGSAFVTNTLEHEFYPESEEIEIKVLDKISSSLNLRSCDFIKIDIEGYELTFLEGAKEFVKEHKPTVVMEVNHWCLNALHRITMPDFIERVLEDFPYVHAFMGGEIIDVRAHKEIFMHENIVHNNMMNIVCGFEEVKQRKILKKYKQLYKANFLPVKPEVDALREELRNCHDTITLLKAQVERKIGVKESSKLMSSALSNRIRKGLNVK